VTRSGAGSDLKTHELAAAFADQLGELVPDLTLVQFATG
jgi:hypothetical protein